MSIPPSATAPSPGLPDRRQGLPSCHGKPSGKDTPRGSDPPHFPHAPSPNRRCSLRSTPPPTPQRTCWRSTVLSPSNVAEISSAALRQVRRHKETGQRKEGVKDQRMRTCTSRLQTDEEATTKNSASQPTRHRSCESEAATPGDSCNQDAPTCAPSPSTKLRTWTRQFGSPTCTPAHHTPLVQPAWSPARATSLCS